MNNNLALCGLISVTTLAIPACSSPTLEYAEVGHHAPIKQVQLREKLTASQGVNLKSDASGAPIRNIFRPNYDLVKSNELKSYKCHQERGCVDSTLPNKTSIRREASSKAEDLSLRSSRTIKQDSKYPNRDLNLVQFPNESRFQAVNKIYTSEVDNGMMLLQSVEYKNVTFNQVNSPNSLHTINATVTDDKTVSGSLKQQFKFKKIEMIQRGSVGSIHSMNYVGER